MESNKFKICLIQSGVSSEGIEINKERVKLMVESAVKLHSPKVVVLSEFWVCKYNKKEFEKYAEEEETSQTVKFMSDLARENNICLIGGSVAEYDRKAQRVYNTCYCFNEKGEKKLKYRKNHLFDVQLKTGFNYKESDSFGTGDKYGVFDTGFCRFGIGICYDMRFPEYCQVLRQEFKCQALVFPSNFHVQTGSMHWELLLRCRALDNNVYTVGVSQSRIYNNPFTYQAWGYSMVVDPYGKIVNSCGYDEAIVLAEIDLQTLEDIGNAIPTWKQKRNDLYSMKCTKYLEY